MTLPKISVVTVSFNQGEFIRQNIESVLAQQYPNFEHIVVDGGSGDQTVEILKSYPHLQWTSKPDNGQTDALNQGFKRATGEIIAWLNSDDWYAPGAFHEAAKALAEYPIVLGQAEITNRAGQTIEVVENIERNWFDILKYWVFHSIPAQPAIFFRREALEAVKRDDGLYLDEDLEFGMDLDLWLRLARRYDFTRRIKKTLAYARMYEENKTGQNMAGAYHEYARLFRRHEALICGAEHRFCFIVPVNEHTSELGAALESLARQTLRDFEVLLVDYDESPDAWRRLKKEMIEIGKQLGIALRVGKAAQPSFQSALDTGFRKSCAQNLVFLAPGTKVGDDFCVRASAVLADNAVGMVVPLGGRADLSALCSEVQGQPVFNFQSIFTDAAFPANLLVRKTALLELGGLRSLGSLGYTLREMALRLVYKGWQVRVSNALEMQAGSGAAAPEVTGVERLRVNAQLILDLHEEFSREPMAALRAKHGFALTFADGLVQEARGLLRGAGKA